MGRSPAALPYALADYNARHDLELATHASAEAQVAALADDVAYNSHDLHDGLRAELFSTDELAELPLLEAVSPRSTELSGPELLPPPARGAAPVFRHSGRGCDPRREARLADLAPQTASDIRRAGRPWCGFRPIVWRDLQDPRFLFHRMYRAPSVVDMRSQVTQVVNELFPLFMERSELLPKQWRKDVAEAKGETALARIVADYIAGMTDRFAIQEHARLLA